MTDPTCDWHTIDIPTHVQNFPALVAAQIHHKLREFIIDPANGTLSASRLMFILINVFGGCAAWVLVLGGFYFKMPAAFTPAAVIFTGLAGSDATVYGISTYKRGQRESRGNGEGE